MQNYSMNIVLIETEEDRNSFYMSMGIKPNIGEAIVKGCFNGEECAAFIVKKKSKQTMFETIQDKLCDELEADALLR